MRLKSGNLRANMQIFKAPGIKDHVVLETEGAVGAYNRANRSLTHFIENSIPAALFIPLSGAIFPFPTFVATVTFAAGRILHQVGYAAVGYGGHGAGFGIAMLSSVFLESLCSLTAFKTILRTP